MSVKTSVAGFRGRDGQRPVLRSSSKEHTMNVSGSILVAIALATGAPSLSSAQATRPGFPATSVAALSEQRSHDDDVCSVNSVRGTYVFSASGFNIVAGAAKPKAIVEIVELNGDGTLSVPAATVSLNGVIIRSMPGVGTYTVTDDCRGTITFTGGPAFDIFVSPNAEIIWMIQTTPDSVFQGTATRTSRGGGRR